MRIRKVSMKDVESLMEIYNKDGVKHRKELMKYPVMDWILQESAVLLMAEEKANKYGFIAVRPREDEARIDLLSVKKVTKAEEVRELLLKKAIQRLEEAKTISVYAPKKQKIAQFYKNQGFEVYNEIKDMYGKSRPGVYLIKSLQTKSDEKTTRILHKKSPYQARLTLKENLQKLDIHMPDEFGGDILDQS